MPNNNNSKSSKQQFARGSLIEHHPTLVHVVFAGLLSPRSEAWLWRGVMLSEMPGAEEDALANFRYALHVEPTRIVNFDYPIKFLFVPTVSVYEVIQCRGCLC